MNFWAIGGFFLILTPVILVHEIGHFVAARLFNIRVDEFGLGFPPRAVTLFERNGTVFSLNWIPLGGFVRPAGEDDPTIPGGLAGASKTARLSVLLAGAVANIILAFILFAITFMLSRPILEIAVSEVVENSPAAQSGLLPEDILYEINGRVIGEEYLILTEEIRSNAGNEVTIVVLRDGNQETIYVTPRRPGEYDASREGAIGIAMRGQETDVMTSMPPLEAIGMAGFTIYDLIRTTIELPIQAISNPEIRSQARVVSVVGISQIAGQATQSSVENGRLQDILWTMAAISVALGFTNLLPIPALDGGRILFVIIEAIRGRRIEPEREGMVHAIGMALLLGLMVILIVQDIVNPIPS